MLMIRFNRPVDTLSALTQVSMRRAIVWRGLHHRLDVQPIGPAVLSKGDVTDRSVWMAACSAGFRPVKTQPEADQLNPGSVPSAS
jgi:hypothetical protein